MKTSKSSPHISIVAYETEKVKDNRARFVVLGVIAEKCAIMEEEH